MDKTRIFVSSTCYDLSQIRRDLEAFIGSCGHQAVLSDSPGVVVPSGLDIIEACRWLVHSSDVFVLIIGGRYGSADATTGKSITNLEYETALAAGLPIYAFVDQEVWNKRDTYARLKEMVEDGTLPEDKLGEALGHKVEDPRVFDFLSQVTRAERDSWIREFSSAQVIIEHLKRSWSLLLKDLLDQRRQEKRSIATAESQPVLSISWQSSSGDPLDVLEVSSPPDVDAKDILAQVSLLRPSPAELQLVRDNRDEIQRRLDKAKPAFNVPRSLGPSMDAFEAFLENLDKVEQAVIAEPKKFRWRYDLLSRGIAPALIVNNSGSCPAEEVVIYIQPSGPRALFGSLSDLDNIDLSLPQSRPDDIEAVLQVASRLSLPAPPTQVSALASVFSNLGSGTSLWPSISSHNVQNFYGGYKNDVEFSIEDGALRVDMPGRLKHGFHRRIATDQPMLYCFLEPGEEVDIAYQVYADNLTVPTRGMLRIRCVSEAD